MHEFIQSSMCAMFSGSGKKTNLFWSVCPVSVIEFLLFMKSMSKETAKSGYVSNSFAYSLIAAIIAL